MRKVGINLYARTDVTHEDYVKIIKELGFGAAFITPMPDSDIYSSAELLSRAGISLDTIHAPWKGVNDMWKDTADAHVPMDAFLHYVDLCHDTGAPIAVIHLSSGEAPPPVTDIGRARFTRLVDYAAQKGVKLAFENQRMLSNLAWVFEEFKDAPHVGFCWDTGHEECFTAGRHYMPLFKDRLICTHIHDNDTVYNHDQHRLPFDANVDFSYVADTIRSSGFDGTLMLEVAGYSDFYKDIGAHEYLRRAYESACRLRDMI